MMMMYLICSHYWCKSKIIFKVKTKSRKFCALFILVISQYQRHSIFPTAYYNDFSVRRSCKFKGCLNSFFLKDLVIKRGAKDLVGTCLTFSINSLSFCFLLCFFKTENIFQRFLFLT